jgi:hypothetical protein
MKRSIWIIVAVVFVFFTGISFAAPNMEDGLWEITTTVDMPGMPSNFFTHKTCLTKEKAVPQTAESGCTIKDVKTQGNTITWTVICREGTSTGKVTYAGTTMDGVIETSVKTNGKTMTMKSTMKGKCIGPCK